MDAENLSYLLALARAGRLNSAARQLRVDETTLSRRITRLEGELGQRVFNRGRSGWALTEAGRRLLPYAEDIESTLAAAYEQVSTTPGKLGGSLRLIAPDGFGAYVLLPGLRNFRVAHPGVSLEISTSTSHDFMTGRDFDLAITLEKPTRNSGNVERLADYELGLYASREYLALHGFPTSLLEVSQHHTVIWYIDAFLDVQPLQILDKMLPDAHAHVQTNNISGHLSAALGGVGIAPLPTYIADSEPYLVRILADEFSAERTYWLAVPHQSARLARTVAMTNSLRTMVEQRDGLRALLA